MTFLFNFQRPRDAEHPRAVADGHADSHDEYDISPCKCSGKSLKKRGEIVVTLFLSLTGNGFDGRRIIKDSRIAWVKAFAPALVVTSITLSPANSIRCPLSGILRISIA
jgi:hypothetical protein